MKKYIISIIVLAHEIIHLYIANYYKDISNNERKNINFNNLKEVYSHFIELLMLDYLENNKLKTNDIELFRDEYNADIVENLTAINTMLEPNDLDFTSIDEVLIYDDLASYSYGKLFAYHFYDNYLKDRELTKDNILKFRIESKNHDFKYMINHYGLEEDKLLDEKVLVRHL